MELFKSRTRVAYTNAVGDKVYPVIVDIKRGIKSTEEIQFMSSDINTGILSVAFIQGNDNYNVSGAEVVCSVMRPDASTLDIPCTSVEDNIVEVPLGINGTSQDGIYSFDFKVFKGGNKVVGTPIMNYSVSLSISNDMVVEEDDRLPVLTMLMTQLTDLKGEARETINQANAATVSSREATANAIVATNNANAVSERVSQEASEVISRVDNKVNEVENRFNALTSSQQQDAEVIDARDGETSLKARLDRDIEKAKQVYVNVEGNHISTDSSDGYLKDVEILGNTIQSASNLADIRSVGDKVEGQELYEIPVLSRGKNLFDGKLKFGEISDSTGQEISSTVNTISCEYTKVPKGSSIGVKGFDATSSYAMVLEYDSSYNFIQKLPISATGLNNIKTLNPKTNYIKFKYQGNQSNLKISVFLNENVATPYELYQEDKLTILSPTQLEKVGDVADRIVCKDGVWGVEKNVKLNDFPHRLAWNIGEQLEKTTRYHVQLLDLKNASDIRPSDASILAPIICNKFPTYKVQDMVGTDVESVGLSSSAFSIRLNNDKLTSLNSDGVNNWIAENGLKILYQTTQPQFIPLPHDQQVKLRTFANKTNISFLTEVEGTIKAQVPKSLGATVNTHTTQINNLNKELDRVKKLEESTVSTVETESDFTTVEATSNGYFEDVKLEGKTLVNLGGKVRGTYNKYSALLNSTQLLAPNSEYTFIVSNTAGHNVDLYINEVIFNNQPTFTVKANSTSIISCTTKDIVNQLSLLKSSSNDGTIINLNVILLEGDHTQNPPSGYIEGLKSVGQDVDEIVVESVNASGNLVEYMELTGVNSTNGEDYTNNKYVRTNYITVEPNQMYYIKPSTNVLYKDYGVYFYDSNKAYLGYKTSLTSEFTTVSNTKFIRFDMLKADDSANTPEDINNCDFVVSKCRVSEYIPHQSDKKRLLYYNEETQTWEKPILREWDSIEKHSDGKYYYHQRSGEVVLNGSEDWSDFSTINGVGKAYTFAIKNKAYGFDNLVCDKLPVTSTFASDATILNGISGTNSNNAIWVSINASITDAQGFKQWLQTNNVTVVYQLAEEKVYECTNIDLITYANETNYIVESGAIAPKSILKVHNNISNVVKILQEKVSLLESNVKASQEVQDMMILETDMRMLDIELALMEFAPMKLNLGGSDMLRSATYFNFVKNHIINETYEKEYLENVMNKYLATGRINQDEYDELYKMLYPPVYDIELPIEL